MSKVLLFRRVDGVIGVGFQMEFGGIDQYSIVWPDKAGERHTLDVAEKMGIVVEVALAGSMEPSDQLVNFGTTENSPPFTPTPEHPVLLSDDGRLYTDEVSNSAPTDSIGNSESTFSPSIDSI